MQLNTSVCTPSSESLVPEFLKRLEKVSAADKRHMCSKRMPSVSPGLRDDVCVCVGGVLSTLHPWITPAPSGFYCSPRCGGGFVRRVMGRRRRSEGHSTTSHCSPATASPLHQRSQTLLKAAQTCRIKVSFSGRFRLKMQNSSLTPPPKKKNANVAVSGPRRHHSHPDVSPPGLNRQPVWLCRWHRRGYA